MFKNISGISKPSLRQEKITRGIKLITMKLKRIARLRAERNIVWRILRMALDRGSRPTDPSMTCEAVAGSGFLLLFSRRNTILLPAKFTNSGRSAHRHFSTHSSRILSISCTRRFAVSNTASLLKKIECFEVSWTSEHFQLHLRRILCQK